ncbi:MULTISPECIES: Bug family tripartite tricarboxylate transporter substrate binding protein [Achromobacter]|uniref:Bug family tripartite tricarboxylate transporter substrate binding protein n=1 Tax=Achromobacter sp. SD115 TaxID=2782011 RepID=UPI001F608E07|nr:tripartite tricarboxylate transporter substrate binding protein [Achromobacter sp. SD115]
MRSIASNRAASAIATRGAARAAWLFAAACCALTATAAADDKYPSHPIKIVVGSEAGSAPDALARVLANEMGPLLGQSIIVENKAGAAGVIGAKSVAMSPKDGYTLLMGTVSNMVLSPSFYPVDYDPAKSFTPIGMVASVPLVLVASPALAVNDYAQLQTKAKGAAVEMSYASPGIGGPQHLAGVLLQRQLGGKLLHIPYKSGNAAMTAVAAGQVDLTFAGIPAATALAQGKRVVPLFVTAARRSGALPDVASAAEAGLPGFAIDNWHALFGPAQLPPAVRAALEGALQKALASPAVKDQFEKAGADPVPGSGKQLEAFVAAESVRWQQVIQENKLKAE